MSEQQTDEVRAAERMILERRAAALARRPQRQVQTETAEVAVFRLGRERYAIDLRCLLQIFPLRDLALLPGARPPLVGLTPWRGVLLRMLDLGSALGRPHTGIADRGRVLVLGREGRADFGILIDMVEDVVALPESGIRPLPGTAQDRTAFLRGVTSEAVLVLDAQELIRTFA
ncbi:MAG: chemotaxis protein CheW [Longimicrobiales bacterium]